MTDNEIIKALECCVDEWDCDHCPCFNKCSDMHKDALDLINRQMEENQNLKGLLEQLKSRYDNATAEIKMLSRNYVECGKIIKAAAIKEFAERLKEHFDDWSDNEKSNTIYVRCLIDNLVEEMTEEKK